MLLGWRILGTVEYGIMWGIHAGNGEAVGKQGSGTKQIMIDEL